MDFDLEKHISALMNAYQLGQADHQILYLCLAFCQQLKFNLLNSIASF